MITMRNQTKYQVIALLALFVVPLVIAYSMYFSGRGIPHHTVNHGTLLQPPLNFWQLPLAEQTNAKSLKGKWLLVYVNPQPCAQTCLDVLYKIRQTRTALGKDQNRLLRVMLSYQPPKPAVQQQIIQNYTGTFLLQTNPNALNNFLGTSAQANETLQQGGLYVVDPLGNMMMVYHLNIVFKPLLGDLKRLLQISQIG